MTKPPRVEWILEWLPVVTTDAGVWEFVFDTRDEAVDKARTVTGTTRIIRREYDSKNG